MTDINWGILKPVDIGAAATDGYNAGRLQARQKATQDILAGYGQNPTAGVPAQLWALDPNIAATLSQNDRQRVVADRQTQDALRETRARGLGANYIRQSLPQQGVPDALGSPTAYDAGMVSPGVTTAGDNITVTARPRAPLQQGPQISIADVFEQDPKMAGDLITHMGALGKNEREAFADKMGVAAAVAAGAKSVPLAQRQAYIDQHSDYLKSAGWTAEQIGGLDPHDDNLDGVIAIGMGADKYLAAHDRAITREEQQRHNRINEGQGAARIGIAGGALSLARQREGRIAKGGGTTADLSGASDEALLALAGGD